MEPKHTLPHSIPGTPYFSQREISSFVKDNQTKHLKLALSDMERCLNKALSVEGFAQETEAAETLVCVRNIRKTLHLMESLDSKKLGTLTEDMLFKTPEDEARHAQNATIDKPALRPFNYLLDIHPHGSRQNHRHRPEQPLKDKTSLPRFFEYDTYEDIPSRISAEDLIHHQDSMGTELLSKPQLREQLLQLYRFKKQQEKAPAPELKDFMIEARSFFYHLPKSNLEQLLKQTPAISLN